MRSDESGWRFQANPSDSHSIHAHGETGRGATQFWPSQALRSAWVMSLHFPDVRMKSERVSAHFTYEGLILAPLQGVGGQEISLKYRQG